MNKIYTLIIAAVLLSTGLVAQEAAAKFGHLNSQELLQLMPETVQAEQELQTHRGALETRLREISANYQAEVDKYTALPEGTPEATINEMRSNIGGIEQRIQEYQVNAERELMTKQESLLNPIIKKLQEAIDAVGNENGFTYIFDTSTGAIVFQNNGADITDLVKTKLGITG